MNAFYCMKIQLNRVDFLNVKVKKDKEILKKCPRLKETKETSQLNVSHDPEQRGKTGINDIRATVEKIRIWAIDEIIVLLSVLNFLILTIVLWL